MRKAVVVSLAALVLGAACAPPPGGGPAGVAGSRKPPAPRPSSVGTATPTADAGAAVTTTIAAGTLIGKVKGPATLISDAGSGLVSDAGSGVVSNNGAGYRLHAVAEVPYPGVEVFLAEATGTALPTFKRATTNARGDYAIPDVPAGRVFLVVGRFTARDGSQKVMQTLVETRAAGTRADLTLATTFVTAGRVDGALPAAFDQAAFDRDAATTAEKLTEADAALLGDVAAMRARLDEIQRSLDRIEDKLDQLLRSPSPSPVPSPSPSPTPKPSPPAFRTQVAPLAGTGAAGAQDGPAAAATFGFLAQAAGRPGGPLYLLDSTAKRIRVLRPGAGGGTVATLDLAGDPAGGLNNPGALAVDGAGNLYVADTRETFANGELVIRKIPMGDPPALVPAAPIAVLTLGGADRAGLGRITAMVADAAGDLFVADAQNQRIHKIAPDGTVTLVAGGVTTTHPYGASLGYMGGFQDGKGKQAFFNQPSAIALAKDGALIVADAGNHAIRRVTRAGEVTTLAGGPPTEAPTGGHADGVADEARFKGPAGLAVDAAAATETIYVADAENHRIRAIVGGVVGTYAGAGTLGTADGPGAEAEFDRPRLLAMGPAGALYVIEPRRVREVRPAP